MATATPKKMSMMQLTVVVAVNMMGSGIIMLPTNMAQVGAISKDARSYHRHQRQQSDHR